MHQGPNKEGRSVNGVTKKAYVVCWEPSEFYSGGQEMVTWVKSHFLSLTQQISIES